MTPQVDDSIRVLDVLDALWKGRFRILAVTFISIVCSAAWSYFSPNWYKSEALLLPTSAKGISPVGGDLGGLAALAGISIGDGDSVEPLAVLKSESFARAFISEKNLLPVLFSNEWNKELEAWDDKDPATRPDYRDGVRFFHEEVLDVRDERDTGLVRISITWKDPELAASWTNEFVNRVNAQMRNYALRESAANIAFLQSQLEVTTVLSLQQSISRVLESELQQMMLARGNEQFAYRIIDAAYPAKEPSRPRRLLLVTGFAFLGFFTSSLLVLIVDRFADLRRKQYERK